MLRLDGGRLLWGGAPHPAPPHSSALARRWCAAAALCLLVAAALAAAVPRPAPRQLWGPAATATAARPAPALAGAARRPPTPPPVAPRPPAQRSAVPLRATRHGHDGEWGLKTAALLAGGWTALLTAAVVGAHRQRPAGFRPAPLLQGPTPVLPQQAGRGSRRAALVGTLALAAPSVAPGPADALPLAPLGRVGEPVGGAKQVGISAEAVAQQLVADLQADGGYFVSGRLTPELFADDCRFADPTNDIRGLRRYLTALPLLFDPRYSSVQDVEVVYVRDDSICLSWTLGGHLKFPWNPRVERFAGRSIYTLDPATGLIIEQRQTWAKSAATALQESFTPTFSPPSPV